MLGDCKDNNERHELLERFKAYVLPHLDNPATAHAEVRHALVASVEAARTTATKPIGTPWGDLPGRTVEDVVELAAEVLDHLRYVSIEAVEATLDAFCELYPGASSDKERQRILNSVERLATLSTGETIENLKVRRRGGRRH